jgi:protein-disulfide isomerase
MSRDEDGTETEGEKTEIDDTLESASEPPAPSDESSPPVRAAASSTSGGAARAASGSKKDRRGKRPVRPATAAAAAPAPERARPRTTEHAVPIWAVGLVGVVLGAAAGWIGHQKFGATSASPSPDKSPTAASSAAAAPAGPCEEWASDVCLRAGETSEGCTQAQAAAKLLPANACVAAKAEVEATVAKLKSARAACDTLTDRLCKDIGPETATCSMVRERTSSFPAAQCDKMLGSYNDVLTELKQMEKANAPLPAELATRQAAGDGPSFGPANAKVSVVEYSDFECPYCTRGAAVVTKLKEKYGDKVRFVFRQFPLAMHENAPLAAEASLAAHAQGKFWPFHDQLFANQRALERPNLEEYAAKVGLDMAKFKKALDDHTYADAVKADMKLAEEAVVSGTPTMFIGAERVANPTDFEAVAKQIDSALAK